MSTAQISPTLDQSLCWPNGADLDPDVLYSLLADEPIELKGAAVAAESRTFKARIS